MEDPFRNQNLPAKVARKKSINLLWLILGGIFLLAVISCVLTFFCWKRLTTDQLIKFAPVDSIVYVSARDSFLPWSDYNISTLPFSDFYKEAENLFELNENQLKDEILNNVSEVAFILLPNEETKDFDSVFIFKTKKSLLPFYNQCEEQEKKVEAILNKQSNYLKIENNIFVIATSAQALEKIKEVVENNIFSLASQVKEQKNDFDLLYFYLNSNNLKVHLEERGDRESVFYNYFAVHNIYSGLKQKNGQWQFDINYPTQAVKHSPLIKYLPRNFSFYASGVNLLEIFSSWGCVDQKLIETFSQATESLKSIYNFDINGLTSGLLDQPIDLIILKPLESSAFGFEYILIAPKLDDEQTNNLENLIKIILSQKVPDQVDYTLPDGSYVTELLARPDSWQWETIELESGLIINYLSESAFNFEIAYLIKDENILISSSANQLETFINNKDIKLSDLLFKFKNIEDYKSFLLFNQPEIFSFPNTYLPNGIIFLQEGKANVKGFIVD